MAHVVWDWNGTLFDDHEVVLEAVNHSLASVGAPPIDGDRYRDHYTRPVHRFYEGLLGRRLHVEEWYQLDRVFHDAYRELLAKARLAEDAEAALWEVEARGWTQSLLSMFDHDELVPLVATHGLAGRFVRVDGRRGPSGVQKESALRAHLADLGIAPDVVVVIGDTVDDAWAGLAVGAAAVLYDGGTHHRHDLEEARVPIADSLVEAVDLGAELLEAR